MFVLALRKFTYFTENSRLFKYVNTAYWDMSMGKDNQFESAVFGAIKCMALNDLDLLLKRFLIKFGE